MIIEYGEKSRAFKFPDGEPYAVLLSREVVFDKTAEGSSDSNLPIKFPTCDKHFRDFEVRLG